MRAGSDNTFRPIFRKGRRARTVMAVSIVVKERRPFPYIADNILPGRRLVFPALSIMPRGVQPFCESPVSRLRPHQEKQPRHHLNILFTYSASTEMNTDQPI
jgi:hypothetical protein